MPSYRCLTPSKFRLRRHRFANIGSGSFQSFAIQEHGTVWGWGSNLYGEGGQESGHIDKIGDGFSIPTVPEVIPAFDIEAGRLFRWGNNAGWQCGVVKREDDPVEEQNNIFSSVPILGAFHYYQRPWLSELSAAFVAPTSGFPSTCYLF